MHTCVRLGFDPKTPLGGQSSFQIVEPQKHHILFIFHIPFITLFLFYPSIKPLISIIFMTKYGLPCYFPNHLFFSILSEIVVNY